MFSLVYVSSAVKLLSTEELTLLLRGCVAFNSKHGLTGMLLYKDGNFMQALEGAETDVRQCYEKIKKDPRHRGLSVLLELQKQERDYPDWAMGFRDLNTVDRLDMPEYSEIMNYPFTGQEFSSHPSLCQKLLLSFKKNM